MKALTYSDVLIIPAYSEIKSRQNVEISTFVSGAISLSLPVISSNMKTITGSDMAIEMRKSGGLGILHRFCSIKEAILEYEKCRKIITGVSVGVKNADKNRIDELIEHGVRIFCIDVAHGHHVLVKDMLKYFNSALNVVVIAGNVATYDGAKALIDWGADVIKVGLGPGSVCYTRKNTGVGVPQLYALHEARRAVEDCKTDTGIIADGGITCVGDIAKALKYADAVMIGNLIAGTTETPGMVVKRRDGLYYKTYGGSASAETKGETKFVEGMVEDVPFKGKVKYILREIKEGLQSAFSYVGAKNLNEFQMKCEFLEISSGTKVESKF